MELQWYKEGVHEALPYSIDFDVDHTDSYIYSGGFDRMLKVSLPKKNKIARSTQLDKTLFKSSDQYFKRWDF